MFCDVFDLNVKHRVHGHSLAPLVLDETSSIRDWLLTGVWGREVEIVTSGWRYARAPMGKNEPLSMWSNRWSTMPVSAMPDLKMPPPDERATLDRMPGSNVPVLRQPFRDGDLLPFWAYASEYQSILVDRREDPDEVRNVVGTRVEDDASELLRAALVSVEAPDDQLVRLGLE
jgi:hypothetical protein